jgi:hypothetical protein
MPNWCNNTIKVQATKERIDEFEKFLNENDGKDWFTHFRPLPEELTNEGWYEWSINNWGCKWNCDANDWQRIDENTISFWFDSPWGPPLALYEFMVDEEFDVRASYHEEGMAFVGEFVDGLDNCYEYEDLDSLDYIPEHLIEDWNIRDLLEDRLDDEHDD